jgi:hypothetical protein
MKYEKDCPSEGFASARGQTPVPPCLRGLRPRESPRESVNPTICSLVSPSICSFVVLFKCTDPGWDQNRGRLAKSGQIGVNLAKNIFCARRNILHQIQIMALPVDSLP